MRAVSFVVGREGRRRRRGRAVAIEGTDEEEERSWETIEREGVARNRGGVSIHVNESTLRERAAYKAINAIASAVE